MLEQRFEKEVAFFNEDIDQTYARWNSTLVDKLLGKGFPIDFI